MRVGEVTNLRRIRSKSAGVATLRTPRAMPSYPTNPSTAAAIFAKVKGLVYEGWLNRIGRVVVPKSRPRGPEWEYARQPASMLIEDIACMPLLAQADSRMLARLGTYPQIR